MDDKDRIFAAFRDDRPTPSDRRETLTIPRRAGATGSRVVEVVHVRSGRPGKDRTPRTDAQLRAASWDQGFPARQVSLAPPPPPAPPAPAPTKPTAHLMPAWEPAPSPPAAPEATPAPVREPRRRPRETQDARRVADPFDASDDGANCLRCGYVVEAARESRGLLTCARCGPA